MMKIDMRFDVRQVTKMLTGVQKKHVPFAQSLAINKTAQLVKEAEREEMKRVLDRPTPFTLNGLMMRPSNKRNLVASVWLKDWTPKGTAAEKYLMPHIKGGGRNVKRFERLFQRIGALPPGYYAVPGAAAEIDGNGNMSRGQIVQIISYFKAFPEQGYKANITDKKKRSLAKGGKNKRGYAYFIARPGGHLHPGIWRRDHFANGSSVKPIVMFVRAPRYREIYDFYGVANRVARQHFADEYRKAMNYALATAK